MHRSVALHGWKSRQSAPMMTATPFPSALRARATRETALNDTAHMQPIVIYTTAICPYCVSAKNFLKSKGLEWTEIRIDTDPVERERMMARARRTSVPQIFVGDVHVGGFDDMMALHRAGRFELLLSGEGA
jgi:glutaredoxin 3